MSCSPDAGLVARRVTLAAVATLAAIGMSAGVALTTATLTGTGVVTSEIGLRAACVPPGAAYTSGMLDDAGATLRWSFTQRSLPVGAVASSATPPTADPTDQGLLVCDPADLARAADPSVTAPAGSLVLPGGLGSGLSAATGALDGPITLLLWVRSGSVAPGELAWLGDDQAGLAVTVSDQATVEVWLLAGAAPPVLAATPVPFPADDRAHLVAVTVAPEAIGLTVDGAAPGPPTPAGGLTLTGGTGTLTVGARPGSVSATATVDEVTVLPRVVATPWLVDLVTADRWWAPTAP